MDYYVLHEGMRPAGHKIWKDAEGKKRVTMTAAAAQYWIDQGAISDRPLESHSLHGRSILGQMTGQQDVPMPKSMRKPDPLASD